MLQGTVEPPTVRLSPEGSIFASTELRIAEIPDVTITVSGIGIDAAGIAESTRGDTLRVEGELAFDPDARTFYIYADRVRRMVQEGGVLVAHAPSMYILRATGASILAASGSDPVLICQMMGDAQLETIRKHYFRSHIGHMQEAMWRVAIPSFDTLSQ